MKNKTFLLLYLLLLSACIQAVEGPVKGANTDTASHYPLLSRTYYNGTDDDLLTAGLGVAGLQAPTPVFVDPLSPTRAELRRNSIHYNFNALVNTSASGGFSRLYGPSAEKANFAGYEFLSYIRDRDNSIIASLLVQLPDNFDVARPCIVAGPSSGSRGIYGAIGVVGPWALDNGCAIAYTDKGTGTGFYNVDSGESWNLWGEYGRHQPGDSLFSLEADPALDDFRGSFPHRLAIKHAHSQTNSEQQWPVFVLHAIHFAFQVLNTHFKDTPELFVPQNTIVIASGTSNGGASSVRAGELDDEQVIDAVVVAEPNLNMPADAGLRLLAGGEEQKIHSRKLLDYSTYISLYLPCALLSESLSEAPFYKQIVPIYRPLQKNRCNSLHQAGLLDAEKTEVQISEALQRLHAYGVLENSHLLDASFMMGRVWEGLSAIYTNAYGRYALTEHACGVSFAVMNQQGRPAALSTIVARGLATISSGFIGTAGIGLSVDTGENAPLEIFQSQGHQQIADMGLQTAICWRQLLSSARVQQGLEEIEVTGDLHGKPGIIVHGRNDSLIHVNHASRPYFGLNNKTEKTNSKLRYYEIENAQHFDAWLKYPEVARHFVPLQYYLEQSLDSMLEHLLSGKALPPSQVVRTTPAAFASGTTADVSMSPGQNLIIYDDYTVNIPR